MRNGVSRYKRDSLNTTNTKASDTIPPLAWLLLALLGLTWGSSYILIKKGLIAFNPQQVAGLRISLSALAFLPVFLLKLPQMDWSKWKELAMVGFAGSFIPAFLFATAQTKLSSSVTGVLSTLTPLFTLLTGFLLFKSAASRGKIFGVVLGLAGASILLLYDSSTENVGNLMYGLLVVLGALLYGYVNNLIKAKLQNISSVLISAASFVFVGIPAFIMLFSSGFISVLETHEHGWESFWYICILSLAGTVMATLFFFKLIQLTNPIFASMVSYIIPMIALMWGFLDGEVIVLIQVAGMVLILGGVYISRK